MQSSVGPSRLQVAAGFSWDVGLNSLKPASAAEEADFSDGEDQDRSSKVRMHQVQLCLFPSLYLNIFCHQTQHLTSFVSASPRRRLAMSSSRRKRQQRRPW